MKSFLTGLAAGLAIGYLTAPRSGKDTRDQLADAANEKTRVIKDQWDKTTSQVNSLVEDVKSQVGIAKSEANVFADKTANKADQYGDDAKRMKDRAKNQYNESVDDTADAAKSGVNKAEGALKL